MDRYDITVEGTKIEPKYLKKMLEERGFKCVFISEPVFRSDNNDKEVILQHKSYGSVDVEDFFNELKNSGMISSFQKYITYNVNRSTESWARTMNYI